MPYFRRLFMGTKTEDLIQALLESLNEHRTSSTAIQSRAQATVELTSLATLAFRNHRGPRFEMEMRTLLSLRNRDGSWPAFAGDDTRGCWATALAVIALISIRHASVDWAAGVEWLLDARGHEADWPWRWKFQTVDTRVKLDPAKYGWSWVPGTTSWVIPTAFSLLALEHVRHLGINRTRVLSKRIDLGASMLLDRMCPGGGWNAGNGVAFGIPYAPYVDATSIALLALQERRYEPRVQASVSWLVTHLPACPSPYSLAWGVLALAVYKRTAPNAAEALPAAAEALVALLSSGGPVPKEPSTLAACVLALQAVEGDNVFEVRG